MAMAGKQAIERAREPPALGGRSTLTPGRSSGKYTWPRFSAPFFPTRRRRRQPRVRRALPVPRPGTLRGAGRERSEEHTSELQSLMRISYAVFCLKKKKKRKVQDKAYNQAR